MSDTPNLGELLRLHKAAQAALPYVRCNPVCSLELDISDCDCRAQKARANLTAALDSTDPFAALVEVARRAASSSGIGDETAPEIADRVAREYLAERGLR